MRVRARVTGVVQGVGYRPFVYGLAHELGLAGFVLNDASGVLVEVEGTAAEAFVERLRSSGPPLARVEGVAWERVPDTGQPGFLIRESPRNGRPDAPIAPDTTTCDACLAELFDPADRRYRYAFINCTDCGPRFTIVTGVPYDRPFTTMAGFAMCTACQAEYDDPSDRRFHAQPNACPECGPRVPGLRGGGGRAAGRPNRRGQGDRRLPPVLPRRRRGRGLAVAVAQAPGGTPVRGHGPRRRGGREADRGGSGPPCVARAADRDREAARGGGDRAVRRPALSRSRGDAPVLAAAPPAARRRGGAAGDDERQRVRRADRL